MVDQLREYIRDLICDGTITQAFYDDSEDVIWEQAADIAEDLDVDTEKYDLKFFGRHFDGSVAGAAWVTVNEGKFEFVITLDDDIPEGLHKELVRDCLEEFDFQNRDDSMILEVSVDNEEDQLVFEGLGLRVLREYVGATIMGNGD